jgi:hypothetical protein
MSLVLSHETSKCASSSFGAANLSPSAFACFAHYFVSWLAGRCYVGIAASHPLGATISVQPGAIFVLPKMLALLPVLHASLVVLPFFRLLPVAPLHVLPLTNQISRDTIIQHWRLSQTRPKLNLTFC